jgi:hypothetical protein
VSFFLFFFLFLFSFFSNWARNHGGILQVIERGPLRRRGLDRLADAVDRQVGDAG